MYGDYHINIVDTPGHADFGGEVERVLGMVDGVLLLVDAVEGPMPQTRFVTKKALALGLKPIVVINKIDRPGARPDWVVDQTFDLFDKLGATDEQLDFPIIYASGLNGWACMDLKDAPSHGGAAADMVPLFDTVLKHVPHPAGRSPDAPLQLQIAALDYSTYIGRLGVGRVLNGRIKPGQVGGGDEPRRPGRHRPHQPGAGLQGSGPRAGGRSRSRRHHHHFRARRHRHRRHHLRPRKPGRPAGAAGGRADADHGLHGQHLAAGRHRRQVRHQPPDPRPPDQGTADQRRVARRRDRRRRRVPRLRSRRTAPHHPARKHASRRLRAGRRQAARGVQGNRRREMRAVRKPHHRPGRRHTRARSWKNSVAAAAS